MTRAKSRLRERHKAQFLRLLAAAPPAQPPCPSCGGPMKAVMVETCGAALSQLSYQCTGCGYAETVVMRSGQQVSPAQRLTGATFH
jgi:transposase